MLDPAEERRKEAEWSKGATNWRRSMRKTACLSYEGRVRNLKKLAKITSAHIMFDLDD